MLFECLISQVGEPIRRTTKRLRPTSLRLEFRDEPSGKSVLVTRREPRHLGVRLFESLGHCVILPESPESSDSPTPSNGGDMAARGARERRQPCAASV